MERQEFLVTAVLAKLEENRVAIQQQWANPQGTETRHFFVDGLLGSDLCSEIYEAFPKDGNGFFNRESFREKKKTSASLDTYAEILANITYALQDARVVQLVADIVGFKEIEPDPKLYAGGLSMMFSGDFLNPHIDNSHDALRERFRRLNLLYYVSPGWSLENGGNFELWDAARENPKTIVSMADRLVVMETNKTSWHSVSPVKVDQPRCCVSNYYFSKQSPDATEYFHVTSFTGRPGEKVKRALGVMDNVLRNTVSKILKVGRGKDQVNKQKARH
ncbi:2OG-Fe(II) oxygenase [Pseudomonas sp. ML96]|uniref:2OG-Fe(II) oxygenase n=1 Tax=Pseudomonas sp. ML96 TaxID=1523503 RepID=UPI0009DE39AB|nr:2OG-Fe(II) oxygenase [Pseudomonas sp. ML96]